MYLFKVFVLLTSLVLIARADTPFSCISCVQTRLGPAEQVYGPVAFPLDNPLFSLQGVGSDLLGYSSNGDAMLIIKGDLNQTITNPLVVLQAGSDGNFDSCGSWLNAAAVDGDKIRGWYHAETYCDYDIGQTFKTIAYCESTDGGLTFEKLSYPNNQIITGNLAPTAGKPIGNGDHTVIVGDDGYYYLFFIDWNDYGHCVARSLISSGGVPGSWTKYYQGSWSEPGIGGNASGLWNLVGTAVYNHISGNLVSAGSGNGISFAFGSDPVTWAKFNVPILFAEGSEWVRTTTSPELIAYPAFVPLEGGAGPLGNSFWLYYTYLEPGTYFTQRHLVRRKVDISFSNDTSNPVQAGVELSRYRAGEASWVTTTVPISGNFSYDQSLGYMITAEMDFTVPLYDCYIDSWDDHMVSVTRCDNTPGITYLRLMGWIYTTKQAHSSQIYRCWNVGTLKHSVSKSADCEGNGLMEFTLGWTLDQ